MKLVQVFNYEELKIPFHDNVKVFEVRHRNRSFGFVILREFIESQAVSFNITEPMTDVEYELLFEEVIDTVRKFGSKVLLHYALTSNPFTDFLLDRGGYILERVEMVLELKGYAPPVFPIPKDVEVAPFLIAPIRDNIKLCFSTLPEYDKFVFSSFSPNSLLNLYTLLYTGREGVFVPEFSLNLYHKGRLSGFIMVNIFSEKVTISEIMVLSPYQGRGFGRLLLSESLRRMLKRGIERVLLSVTKKNKRAYDMYKRFGFKEKREYAVYIFNIK